MATSKSETIEHVEARLLMKKELNLLSKRIKGNIDLIKKDMQDRLDENEMLAASEDFMMLNNILDMAISQSILVGSMLADLAKTSPEKIYDYQDSVTHTLDFILESTGLMEQSLRA